MIADHETNVVYVADTLEPRLPEVHRGLKSVLEDHGIPFKVIPGTLDVWCRDYLPVQVGENRFVQFRFAPDYLRGRHRHLRRDGEIGPTLPWVRECVRSEIVLDGGNIVKWSDKVIMTERIFEENPGWEPPRLLAELERLLEVERVVLIPPEPEDVTGHADGVVRFVDGETVVISDFRRVDPGYRGVLRQRLAGAGLRIVEVPYRPVSASWQGMPSAVGNYVNFLRVGRLLVVPAYGRAEDEDARRSLAEAHPGVVVTSLACRRLAAKGGVLNCSSWSVQAEEVPGGETLSGAAEQTRVNEVSRCHS